MVTAQKKWQEARKYLLKRRFTEWEINAENQLIHKWSIFLLGAVTTLFVFAIVIRIIFL